ncbi:hypothetical protein BOX15_Mlig025577g2, partial [Macrostomum lignano]
RMLRTVIAFCKAKLALIPMYTSWRKWKNSSEKHQHSESSNQCSTLIVPATVPRWSFPAELIQQQPAVSKDSSTPKCRQVKPAWPDAAAVQKRLADGFERLLNTLLMLLKPTLRTCEAPAALTRDDLLSVAELSSTQLGLTRIRRRQLSRLADELWNLLVSLTDVSDLQALKRPTAPLPITAASLRSGLSRRVQTRLDFFTLRRSLLRLAADLFALLSEPGVPANWPARLLEAVQFSESVSPASGLQFVEVRTALVDASRSEGNRAGTQFDGRWQRDTWMRLVHAQFF